MELVAMLCRIRQFHRLNWPPVRISADRRSYAVQDSTISQDFYSRKETEMQKSFLRANCRGAGTRNEDGFGKGNSGGGGGALNEQRSSLREQAR